MISRTLPVLALACLLLGTAAPAPAAPGETLGRATTAGRWIVDESGRVIIVHGENVVSKTAPYTPQSYGFDTSDAEFLRDNGFNGVRLGIIWEGVEPEPGVFDAGYLDSVAATVDLLAAHGIRTVVEFHQDKWGSVTGGAGAPAWATQTEGMPIVDGSIYASLVSPAVYQAFSNFFANSPAPDGRGLLDHFAAAWTQVAHRLRHTDGVMGYGIINEPFQGIFQDLCAPTEPDCPAPAPQLRLRQFQDRIETAIRAVDPGTPIFESDYILAAAGVVGELVPPTHSGIVHGYNSYALPCALGQPVPVTVCIPFYVSNAQKAREVTESENLPVVLTEFGATDNPEILRYQTDLTDADMTSWFHWNYGGHDPSTTAASQEIEGILVDARRDPVGGNINRGNLTALVRPYPQLVSGTPRSWNFDRTTSRFTFTYSVRRADNSGDFPSGSTTTIAVPPLTYPNGVDVRVTGGRVAETGDGFVTITSDGTAQDISVEIGGL
ncbi:cellulase family glycosylhydrolase [Nocardia huaxiensis]|uniref:Cellulase family glycosylhydrolase n=1 Tax=Nocardia huaxiensis TaxID=2755382 RepID=A0A7D6ZQG5_9NOCA|nr:cellulase family glycosylhydrolase [Nocardia huaxiensis]QLY32843.1 cellulase family glycosylhydrolase [Nocardia huaxiensis]UFS93403.1 cellulase family glycosylhydrolase [Nocardia huaxiensis]